MRLTRLVFYRCIGIAADEIADRIAIGFPQERHIRSSKKRQNEAAKGRRNHRRCRRRRRRRRCRRRCRHHRICLRICHLAADAYAEFACSTSASTSPGNIFRYDDATPTLLLNLHHINLVRRRHSSERDKMMLN